jgi:hypothetical protein
VRASFAAAPLAPALSPRERKKATTMAKRRRKGKKRKRKGKSDRLKLLRSGLRLRVPPPKVEPPKKAYQRERQKRRDREQIKRELDEVE